MKIKDYIQSIFSRKDNHTLHYNLHAYGLPLEISRHMFGEMEYLNIVQLLTDLYAGVKWVSLAAETPKYKAWIDFLNRNGQRILTDLFVGKGYVVIGYNSQISDDGKAMWTFRQLADTEFTIHDDRDRKYVTAKNPEQLFYVIKSPTYEQTGKSDHEWCKGYIAMIDAVLNGATTTAERLGAYVMMSPKNDNFGGTMNETEKKELEKELAQDYGMLGRQRQSMVLSRPMDATVISLAAVDTRMKDKVQTAVLAIADRLKVPANQIALIDANASKSLSNGTELREGDLSKFRSFRRLLNATFFDMANELGLRVDYTIEDEPKTVQGQNIETKPTE